MEKFKKIESNAIPLPMVNVDTDMIIPKQFLKTIKRTGLGKNLFYELRYDEKDAPIDSFVLNQDKYKDSQILITGKNFGCGSSREHAPWSILDYGIKCIIASSFADIFYNNCFKNGILPIKLDDSEVTKLQKAAENSLSFTIDLENQKISYFDKNINHEVSFELDKAKKTSLLEGLDDIGLTLAKVNHISDFENKQKSRTPWLYSQQIK
jgi:3-isopropylmalate/(R)-2-methylmalate dehydratase small subunit